MMNERKQKFAHAFFRLNNIKLAAMEVGYSPNTATANGNRLLKDIGVSAILKELRDKAEEESFLETINVAKSFKQIFDRCMQHEPVMQYNYQTKQMEPVRDDEGNALFTFDSNGANRAMENIAKHIGFYELDNTQKAPVINIAILNNGNSDAQDAGTTTTNQLTNPGVLTLLPPSSDE